MEAINDVNDAIDATDGDRFAVRRKHVVRGTMLTVVLFLASVAVGGSGALGADSEGVLFGAFASPGGNQTAKSAVQALESDLGTKLPLVRGFERWNSNLDNSFNNWVVDGDRTLMLSVKPQRSNGQQVAWRSIANAQPGSTIHNEMVALAQDVKGLNGEVWMTFHHEPEAKTRTSYGSDADFKAAWRKFHSVFEQQGADVTWVWTMTSWSFEVNTSDRRSAGKWYPGDAFVDYLGADPYNWAQCRNTREKNASLERVITPFMKFAEQHPTKKLVLPEFASHQVSASAKAQWLDQVRTFMKKPENASRFAAIIYFHGGDSDAPNCEWELDSSSQSMAAARRIAQDPFFSQDGGAAPTPPAAPAPAPAAPAPAAPAPAPAAPAAPTPAGEITLKGRCTVEAVNGADKITWTAQGDRFGYNVRRNDKWVANVGSRTTLTNNNVTSGNYLVVARQGGRVGRMTCTRTAAGAAPVAAPVATPASPTLTPIPAIGGCRVDRENGNDLVTWPNQGSGFSYQVLRNGTQIATTDKTWHKNVGVTSGNYVVRAIKGNNVAPLNCRLR